jgi:N-acetylneuraminate synthase
MNELEFIGEIGVNHNGDISIAKELINVIHESGAQVAKLQLFRPEALVKASSRLANYQIENGVTASSQSEMLESLLLSPDDVLELDSFSKKLGIELLVTPFDTESMRFLIKELKHSRIKFSSGDLTFHKLIFETAREGVELLVSTGMSTLKEIESALVVARAGFLVNNGNLPKNFIPSIENLETYNTQISATAFSQLPVSLLHCTSTYPAPLNQLNISALKAMSDFGVKLGYSDHSLSDVGATLALAYGARIFEKHVTLSKKMLGPDHLASLEPEEFARYVRDLESAKLALGTGEKAPQDSELDVKDVARRGLYAARPIPAGEIIGYDSLIALRPESKIGADQEFEVMGRKSNKNYEIGDSFE